MASLGTAPLIHEYMIEEDERGASGAQTFLLAYLEAVLQWLYRQEGYDAAGQLESWLAPDEGLLRLYDGENRLRLTEAEARAVAQQEALTLAEQERRARRQVENRLAALQEALRAQGIDPDRL